MLYGMQDLARNMIGMRKREATSDESSVMSGSQPITPHSSRFTSDLRPSEFWALQGINFELKRGECLGLIGRNGCGKSTLLRLIAGIFPPDAGGIAIRGRVGALISLGAGFHPHMTGRENIFLNGTILGMHREEIEAQLEDIIDFAGIGDFIDAPVSTYSSGMTVRLGFSIASSIQPDLLLIDEVLAVGDAGFRGKCYNRIGQLLKNAGVIFVSHSMQQVSQICTSVLFMEKGVARHYPKTADGVAEYMNTNFEEKKGEQALLIEHPVTGGDVTFSPVEIEHGECISVRAELDLDEPIINGSVRDPFYNREGVVVAEWHSKREGIGIDLEQGRNVIDLKIGPMHLGRGVYEVAFVLNDSTGVLLPFWSLRRHSITVKCSLIGACDYQLPVSSYKCSHIAGSE